MDFAPLWKAVHVPSWPHGAAALGNLTDFALGAASCTSPNPYQKCSVSDLSSSFYINYLERGQGKACHGTAWHLYPADNTITIGL